MFILNDGRPLQIGSIGLGVWSDTVPRVASGGETSLLTQPTGMTTCCSPARRGLVVARYTVAGISKVRSKVRGRAVAGLFF